MGRPVFNEKVGQVREPDTLTSGVVSALRGVETVVKSRTVANGYYSYLSSLALSADALAGKNIEFRVYIGGVRANFPYAKRATQLANIGDPFYFNRPHPVPGGVTVEVRAYNADAAADYDVECDGEVSYYNEPLY